MHSAESRTLIWDNCCTVGGQLVSIINAPELLITLHLIQPTLFYPDIAFELNGAKISNSLNVV
jgi:hypothetical protein